MGNKRNRQGRRKKCRNTIHRNIYKRGRGRRPNTTTQNLQNSVDFSPGLEMSNSSCSSEYPLEAIVPETEEFKLNELGAQPTTQIENSGESQTLDYVEKSLVEVKSIVDLLNWLDSCGTINITEANGENDIEGIRNQIFRFYSEIFKGPCYQTHDLRQRKPRTTTGITPKKNPKRTCKIAQAQPKNLMKTNLSNPNQSSGSNEISVNSEGLNPDWTLLYPTINGGPVGTIGMGEFQNDTNDFEDLIPSPPNFDDPAADDLDLLDPANVIPVPNSNPLLSGKQRKTKSNGCGQYICEHCGKIFTNRGTLTQHLDTHTDKTTKSFVCQTCGKGFHGARNLRIHGKVHEQRTKRFLCDQCPRAYFYHYHLVNHQQNHSEVKKYVCSICQRGFHQPNHLRDHTLTHSNERPMKCTFCPKAFKRDDNLRAHIRIHTGDKRYKCEPCGKGFVQIGSLIFHNRTHHGIVKPREQY